jgi:hypothetical protein
MQAPRLGPTPEEVRRPFHDLYLLSLPDELREEVVTALPGGVPVMEGVAEEMHDAPVQPVYKLHAVASALVRKPGLLAGPTDASFLATAIMTGQDDRGRVEDGLKDFALQQQAEAEHADAGRLTPARWQQFLEAIGRQEEEMQEPGEMLLISKPGCNDGETVGTDDGDAAIIISRFWTTHNLRAMSYFVEPKNWKECGAPFWSDVRPVGRPTHPTSNPLDYDATFDEIVNLPLDITLRVRLDVKYRVQATLVRLDYDLSPVDPYGQVTFDSGFLAVTTDTFGDHGEETLVEGAKAIRFTDPLLNRLPDLACDGGWVYMMINMALNGTGVDPLGPPQVSEEAAPAGFAPITATLEEEIDAWIKLASNSLANHGASAKSVTRRVLAPQHDPRWINDLVGMADGAVAMTGATLGAWRRILRRLGNLEGP